MRYFPIFLDLQNRRVVVVGGGEEALRKIRLLLKADARIDVIAETLHPEIAANERIRWADRAFRPELLDGAALVYAADAGLNEAVSAAARERGIPVNAVDDVLLSSFITPSIVDRDPVVVAIGTEGTAPVLAQGIRARIEAMLPVQLGALARAAQDLRGRVAASVPAGKRRRDFWQRFFFGAIRDNFLCGNHDGFAEAVKTGLNRPTNAHAGRVSLVGAGPGDAELLTLKAHRLLQEADVIVHDRLIGPSVLEFARRDAVRIPVGKTPFQPSPGQDEINTILIREARAGKHVVRLKGGDPYIFGRGGEEQAALESAGIAVDVVPGITAAMGCAASIGLPLTQRGKNRSITLLTGSSDTGSASHDWQALARSGSAFAVYMGVHAAGDIAAALLEAGIDPLTAVTLVENGTLPGERVFTTTIGALWETIHTKGVAGPAMIYVGLSKAAMSADIVPFPVRDDIRDAVLRAAS